jgi:hypothetical protein
MKLFYDKAAPLKSGYLRKYLKISMKLGTIELRIK